MKHEIITMRLEDLKPAKYNPRRISPEAQEKLSASIKKFGMLQPIIWNKQTGNIVGGHQRFKILKARGDDLVEVVQIDCDEKTEKAINITLNNKGLQGDFTKDVFEIINDLALDEIFEDIGLDQFASKPDVRFEEDFLFDDEPKKGWILINVRENLINDVIDSLQKFTNDGIKIEASFGNR